jgi:peptidoglycan/xylan/chitin deacetylase (PgdA/CDA1 family)
LPFRFPLSAFSLSAFVFAMRLDRFITLNLVQPGRRLLVKPPSPQGGEGRGEVALSSLKSQLSTLNSLLPVLMYHRIAADPEPGVHPYYRVCTSPQRFREQMQWLKEHGYQGVSLGEALAWQASNSKFKSAIGKDEVSQPVNFQPSTINPKLVALTFDDGFQDFYTDAWPALQEFGFTATMYLPTAFISDQRRAFAPQTKTESRKQKAETIPDPGAQTPELLIQSAIGNRQSATGSAINHQPSTKPYCLNWSEIKELHRDGIEFGSHTVNHPELVELTRPEIESEIQNSKLEIENHLGTACTAFAYPYAFPQADPDFVERFRDLLATAGYHSNVTTQIGRHESGHDLLQIKRLPVNQADDLALFAAKLTGAYDWLGKIQGLSKTLRRRKASNRNHAPVSPARLSETQSSKPGA